MTPAVNEPVPDAAHRPAMSAYAAHRPQGARTGGFVTAAPNGATGPTAAGRRRENVTGELERPGAGAPGVRGRAAASGPFGASELVGEPGTVGVSGPLGGTEAVGGGGAAQEAETGGGTQPASGYAALRQGGEVQPWTEAAIRLWERAHAAAGAGGGGSGAGVDADADADVDVVHHLAIAHHARAYDLEAAGDDAAFGHFEKALGHWAALHGDPRFWRLAHRRLAHSLDAAVPDDVVDQARARLPHNLLEPHLTLAARMRRADPDRARRHMRLVTGAPFPAAVVAEARAGLVRDVLDGVPRAVAEGRFEETLDTLESWLYLDPGSPGLLRALLFTARSRIELLRDEPYTKHLTGELLDRVEACVRPGLAAAPEPAGELAKELARHEFLLALRAFGALGSPPPSPDALASPAAVEQARHGAREAARHVERARELYPEIGDETGYADIDELDGRQLPRFTAWLAAVDAQFLLTAFGAGSDDLARARRLVDEAAAYAPHDPGLEDFVRSLTNLLSLRGA